MGRLSQIILGVLEKEADRDLTHRQERRKHCNHRGQYWIDMVTSNQTPAGT
jgi:hypothetical protein